MKKLKKALIIIIIICIINLIVYGINYYLVNHNKNPFLLLKLGAYQDGGTVEYYGLGYKVIFFNKIEDNFIGVKPRYIGPFWVNYNEAYKKCVGEAYSLLNVMEDKETYLALCSIYPKNEVDEKVIDREKNNHELEYCYYVMDSYGNEKLSNENKEILKNYVALYYKNHWGNMSDDVKSKLDIFLYGTDYTKVN